MTKPKDLGTFSPSQLLYLKEITDRIDRLAGIFHAQDDNLGSHIEALREHQRSIVATRLSSIVERLDALEAAVGPLWKTGLGYTLPMRQMTDDHLANAIAYLEGKKPTWHRDPKQAQQKLGELKAEKSRREHVLKWDFKGRDADDLNWDAATCAVPPTCSARWENEVKGSGRPRTVPTDSFDGLDPGTRHMAESAFAKKVMARIAVSEIRKILGAIRGGFYGQGARSAEFELRPLLNQLDANLR